LFCFVFLLRKHRSTSICSNDSKAKHFKRTISFENIRRLSTDRSTDHCQRQANNRVKLNELIDNEISFLTQLTAIQTMPTDLYESILQFLHTTNSTCIDQLTHELFVDMLPKIIRIIPDKYRLILLQQVMQPFFVSGTHLQQRDLSPYSSIHTLLEAFTSLFVNEPTMNEFVPLIRPIVLKYIGKTHNTWHRSILLLEQYILDNMSTSGRIRQRFVHVYLIIRITNRLFRCFQYG
jgi:hypothetical protein